MGLNNYQVVKSNPNENQGGSGCLCHPDGTTDCKGPYVVFFASETDSTLSPHAVVSADCIKAAADDVEREALDASS